MFWLGVAIPSLIAFGRLLEIGLKNSFAAFGSSPASPIQTRTDLTLQFTAITLATATTVLFLGLIADRRDRERPAVALVVYTIIGLVCTGLNLFVLWGSKLE